ncbi:RNA polymerase subunit sigma-24 [Chromobacterium haemolyticum]|uniref:RNA polymerase sigma factor n=1 Tax=Chromobacterium haemolyticum TaxID=394935 RepID=UPI0009DB2531|nr:sigma-70 family RNA polymerase sigma factor [Chromobacterium haemolyticum]OQS30887.1 RNA polymerase subunit sigma-24 [Chromobacterium haemolyticum]
MSEAAQQRFHRLLVDSIPRLRRYARALMFDQGAADDLVQDTLEQAWRKWRQWRDDRDLRPWLFGIMHRLHIDDFRRYGARRQPLAEDMAELTVDAPQERGLALRELAANLARLPEEQRAVLLLLALEDMSYQQIAAALDIPLGTVMSRLSRGRERLRGLMETGAAPAAGGGA